ncbi:FAD-dependent oxidoreductase [Alteribacter lacisalsi]|jgi:2-polyprenyl-6-methoxyphenol hydroxylase-like FAD-dependent oxidoreductase|uniref:FAD-dependent oxidoreductase n=1 Tax=Alteribacter lacisalsi TaxID=2045244 RepID=A0A2W0HAW2_9BACI|nr:NAD(P)/FAD-dependent oxidoreductase [Alteribacter lacisalsi]PYZ98307.1 FAD-dependent oxidoreductase [Alteribacter lacisalsi]
MDYDVIIIGGGVGGLTLGLTLSREGIRTLVVEKDPKGGLVYKGELLQPKSLQILDKLNVLDPLLPNSYQLDRIHTFEVELKEGDRPQTLCHSRLNYNLLPTKYNHARMAPHEKIRALLMESAERYPHFEMWKPAVFERMEDRGNVKAAYIKKGKEVFEITARVVIGAEGRLSKVRKAMEVSLHSMQYNHHFLTVTFPRPPSLTEATIFAARNHFVGLFPLPDQQVRSVYMIEPGRYKEMRKAGLEPVFQAYYDFMPEMKGYVDQIQKWKEIQLMIPIRHNTSHYVDNGSAILGDAAHSVHPMAGEGMNMAIQDADILGELLIWMKERDQWGKEQLDWYERVRKPRSEFISGLSHQSALVYSFSSRPWQKVRMRALRYLEQDPRLHFKHLLNISGMGMWKMNLLDWPRHMGFPPGQTKRYRMGEEEMERRFFTEKDDYPWRTK